MGKFGFTRGRSIAIDLGNNNTILTDMEANLYSQPSFVALNRENSSITAVGNEAYSMIGKSPLNVKVVKPLKGGVISDFNSASKMLKAMFRNFHKRNSFFENFDTVITGVPFNTTEVERRALRDALTQFNTSKTYLLFEPIAAAIGIGLDIQDSNGIFLVDIGGGITEAVVISLSGIVNYDSIKVAGDNFDTEIQQYIKKNYKIDIGLNMAEKIKINVGAAQILDEDIPEPYYFVGKDSTSGIPKGIYIDHLEVQFILNDAISKIEQAILKTLEECPPELASDIYVSGIHLTGGGSLLRGFKERLEQKFKLPVHHDPNSLLSVSNGISMVLKDINKFKPVLFK